ncbi:MAG: TfoX/Sxy family protein [Clostridiales bacterium]|nr:TfoX/Sxy family protein [Clostridiales bacterium]
MATDKNFVNEFLDGLFEVRVYPMMGEYVLYCRDKVVGSICDNRLFIKVTPVSQKLLKDFPMEPPYLGAKPHFLVETTDKSFLQDLLFAVADGLPAPKKKK